MLTGVSNCRNSTSCAGTADETKTTIGYNGSLLPISITIGSGDGTLSATTAVSYDAIGNIVSIDGPLSGAGDTTTLTYDLMRRLTGVISPDPDGNGALNRRAKIIHYAATGLADTISIGTADAAGGSFAELQRETIGYDAYRRRTADTVSAGGSVYSVTHFNYDGDGRPRCSATRMDPSQWGSQSDACTPQTTGPYGPDRISYVHYEPAGRPDYTISGYGTSAAATDTTLTYTVNGQIASAKDANGNVTNYGYDGFDRRVTTTFPGGTFEQLAFDGNGNVTSRRLRDNQTISYTYDALNRMTNDGQNHTFAYDLLGHLTSANDGNNAYENFTWDALGRKTSESAAYGGTSSMQYDAAGRRTRLTWADGFYVTYDYDTLGEMTGIHENGGTLLASLSYDDLGRRTSLTRPNGTSTTYGYDGASRLSGLNLNGGPSNGYGFAYNPAGQITSRTSSNDAFAWTGAINVNRGYTTNGLNQYTQSGNVTPSYDGRGNLTSAGGATYGYDLQNQMTTFSGGYIYRNALGQWLDVNTEQQWMVHDDDRTIEEFGYDGTVHRRYVYGPGVDEPLVWYEGSGTNDRRFLHADERGSIVAVSDSNGGTIAINSYDEFGIPGANNAGRFQYTGQRWIPALGMYDYKARIYSPTFGRFLQTDPIGYADGMNWYNYVQSDPINFNDPSGLLAIPTGVVVYSPCVAGTHIVGYNNGIANCVPNARNYTANHIVNANPGVSPPDGNTVDQPQNDIVVTAKRLFCKAGSYEFGGEGAAYLGAGIRYSGALAYNTATGDVFLKGSFGGGIGLGGGGSAGLSAQSGSTQAGSRSTLGSRIAAGLGFLGFDINYNYVTNDHGARSSQGASGSVGVAKAFGTAYVALLEASAEGARKLGNIGTICK